MWQRLGPLRVKPAAEGCPDTVQLSLTSDQAAETRVSSSWVQRAALGAMATVMLSGVAMAGPPATGLIVTTGAAAARPAEAIQLAQRLAPVDPGIVRLLEQDGVSFAVVRPGIPFLETGVIPTRSLESYQAQLPLMQAQARAAQQAARPYDSGIRTLQQQRAGATQPEQIQSLDQRLGEMQRNKRQAILEVVGPEAIPYSIPSLAGLLRDKDGLHKLVTQQAMPKGTTAMAQLVGAKRPEQIREYTSLVEAINGPRLQEARADSLARASQAQRELWNKDPGQIPIDIKGYTILVPDLAFVPDGAGGVARTSVLDASVVGAWADASGKTMGTLSNNQGSSINGQYFSATRRILIQSSKVAPKSSQAHAHTPVHELGHAVEDAVQRHDPLFYGRWSARLEAAYSRAISNGTVSEYAGSNSAEYVAEGVGHYYEDPNLLKSKDPQLFQLTQQLLERAAQLGQKFTTRS